MKTLALVPLLALLTGCLGTGGIGSVAEHLSNDNATVKLDIPTPYGMAKVLRTNPRDGHDVIISPDGTVTIKGNSEQLAP